MVLFELFDSCQGNEIDEFEDSENRRPNNSPRNPPISLSKLRNSKAMFRVISS